MAQRNTDTNPEQQQGQALPDLSQNAVKDPDTWTTGDEPMTGPQASYLSTLMQQAGRDQSELDPKTTKADASKLIDQLQEETGRGADGGNS
jgi:hypothetical protein